MEQQVSATVIETFAGFQSHIDLARAVIQTDSSRVIHELFVKVLLTHQVLNGTLDVGV